MNTPNPTPHWEYLNSILHYDEWDGTFVWKKQLSNRGLVGTPAGCINQKGYLIIKIAGVRYPAARLAWKMMMREEPEHEIDHINRDKLDNRWCNLRDITHKDNLDNRSVCRDELGRYRSL